MIDNIINNSLIKLESYIESESHKGYDPYDTLNSCIPFHFFGKWPGIFATQLQKRNPINIRPILGIKKEINPKGYGLFLQAYSLRYKQTEEKKYLEKAEYIFKWLCENYTKGYSGYCWGYNFPWASTDKYVNRYIPSSVVTGIIGKGIISYYEVSKNPHAITILQSICDFLTGSLETTVDNTGLCASYTPLERDCCYNASLLGTEVISYVAQYNNNNKLKEYSIKSLNFVTTRQKNDGKWNYSLDLQTGKERRQIDFHQGYVIESIYNIIKHLELDDDTFRRSVERGAKYYYNEQFFKNGQSKYRIPKVWPVDIHNQAQGIITFNLLKSYNSEFERFSKVIAEWTVRNMRNKNTGHFYYKKYPLYSHKTSYIRWSQAWMFLALAHLSLSNS